MTARKGDKVRVTFEGRYFPYTDYATVETPDGLALAVPADATIEVLEDLRPGDVYRVPNGEVAVYVPGAGEVERTSWCLLRKNGREYDWVENVDVPRPLTLLVRDGKPVTP
jgi:hypothetical protein